MYSDLVVKVGEDELEDFLSYLPVFDSEKEDAIEDNGGSSFVPEIIKSNKMKFTPEQKAELDILTEKAWELDKKFPMPNEDEIF